MAQVEIERWFSEHGDAMFRYARLRLWDDASAEDAVQEAFLSAMDAVRKGGSSERTWLIGILRHKVIDAIRADVRARPVDVRAAIGQGKGPFVLGLWRRKQTEESVEAVVSLDQAEIHAALQVGLGELPDLMRRVLILREVDGLDTEAVSKVLDISPTYVWTLVHRAKVRLRETLEEHAGELGSVGQGTR